MRKMSRSDWLDEISMKFWKDARRAGLEWLIGLFNVLFRKKKMLDE